MKRAILEILLIGTVFVFLFSTAFGQIKKSESKPVEPTAKEAIRQVLLNGNIPLSAGQNCASVKTSKDDRTILDFISGVLAFQTETKTNNSLEFSFKQEKGKRNEIIWVCDVLFRSGDAESSAGNGIRFKMLNLKRRLIRDSLMCIGTG